MNSDFNDNIDEYIEHNNVQFIRLTFFDIFGGQRNIAILPQQLKRAVEEGIAFDASAIPGFSWDSRSDLFLEPDLKTLSVVPWRSIEGSVVRVFCDITYPDGSPFEKDCRQLLKKAEKKAREMGIYVEFGTEVEFYMLKCDENGIPTKEPHDLAGYLSVSPGDRGENVRRDICQLLMEMGIIPEASHHEQGPGQHEVDFRHGDPLQTADNTSTCKWIVENVVRSEGCYADFSPKPLRDRPGNGMHLNISLQSKDKEDYMYMFMAGVMEHIREMTLFLNPRPESYERLGSMEAPGFISWSEQNRSQLIRVPAVRSGRKRFELRSPDPAANPYLAYTLLIHAGLDGIRKRAKLIPPVDLDLNTAPAEILGKLERLPSHLEEAVRYALESGFIKEVLPDDLVRAYCDQA